MLSLNIKRTAIPKNSINTIKGWFWNKEKNCWDYIKDPQYDLNTRQNVYYILYFGSCVYVTYEKTKDEKYGQILDYIGYKLDLIKENFKYNNMSGITRIINGDKYLKYALKEGKKWAKQDHNDFPY